MPDHTLLAPTAAPADLQSPPKRDRITLGDVLVFLIAPFVAIGYYAVVTLLKFLGRKRSRNAPPS